MFSVIDLETTGLKSTSEIAQMSIFTLDDMLNIVDYKDMYFSIHDEMPEEAFKVNKLSKSMLDGLSGGKYFTDSVDEILSILSDNILVAHNAQFEKKMLNNWIGDAMKDREWICTMLRYTPTLALRDNAGNGGYKYCNLRELVQFSLTVSGEKYDDLRIRYKDLTGKDSMYHDSLFDTLCTAYAFKVLG